MRAILIDELLFTYLVLLAYTANKSRRWFMINSGSIELRTLLIIRRCLRFFNLLIGYLGTSFGSSLGAVHSLTLACRFSLS